MLHIRVDTLCSRPYIADFHVSICAIVCADADALPDHEQEPGPQEGCHHVPGGSVQPRGALCHQVSHCQHTQIWYLSPLLKTVLHAMTLPCDVVSSHGLHAQAHAYFTQTESC